MLNFEYKNPVKIIFGKETIPQIAKEIPGGKKVLLTYGGGSIKRNGIYSRVKKALENFEVIEFGGIEVNPHYETCLKAVEVIKKESVDFLLAVGGGSVLDATKFMAAAVYFNGGEPWDILAKGAKIEKAMPLADVITLPATGSEMNGNSVITRAEIPRKLAFSSQLVMPRFSVLDPEVVFSLPGRQVANGVVDAFVHVMEQYLTYPVNSPIQDRFAESILLTLIEEGPKVLRNRADYDAAANFMWSATMALNGLIAAGVPEDWATHQIGHELTALHGIDHARTLAVVLPGVMNIRRGQKKEKIIQYGQRIWGITEGSDDEIIDAAIAKTEWFFQSFGIPTTLPAYNVTTDTISEIVARFKRQGKPIGETKEVTPEIIQLILEDRM
ncbi:NADPH-dependent broad range aldehyde dehydrogenase YqhD [hydrothermal vent metagenome]|uniref:NADPH-dependent broad range aldehyde dehydrogenase YqhD n=1 Tax=hydrothermal vent metagenome TaxID=652676 RepID=A0A3B0UEP1_9ZZZZ